MTVKSPRRVAIGNLPMYPLSVMPNRLIYPGHLKLFNSRSNVSALSSNSRSSSRGNSSVKGLRSTSLPPPNSCRLIARCPSVSVRWNAVLRFNNFRKCFSCVKNWKRESNFQGSAHAKSLVCHAGSPRWTQCLLHPQSSRRPLVAYRCLETRKQAQCRPQL